MIYVMSMYICIYEKLGRYLIRFWKHYAINVI